MASRHCTDGTPSGIRCNGMESSLGSCLSSHLFSSIAVRRFYAALTRITRPTTRARWCKRQEEQIIPCKMVYQGERKQSARQIDACWLSNTGALFLFICNMSTNHRCWLAVLPVQLSAKEQASADPEMPNLWQNRCRSETILRFSVDDRNRVQEHAHILIDRFHNTELSKCLLQCGDAADWI